MKKIHMKKPRISTNKKTLCKDQGYEKLDPSGYFLIRLKKDKIEVGICDYKHINKIKKIWVGKKPQDIYRQITHDIPSLKNDHCAYLGKELTFAWICMKLKKRYVQDGNFLEIK